MIDQRVTHRPMAGWRGVALIGAVALAVIGLSSLFSALEGVLGSLWASLLFILSGMAVAGYLLNTYVLGFRYLLENGCLKISRIYGKRQRPMADLWLNGMVACGTVEAMRRRYPGARVQRAVKRDCPLSVLAVAYRDGGRIAIMALQPEKALRDRIIQAVKEK